MSDMNERSDAMRGSLPVALANYKQLARDCGVDEGIDLPVVAMAFLHGAAYGAKHHTLTDAEASALEFMLRHAAWACDQEVYHDSGDYRQHHDEVFRLMGRK